MLGVKLDNRESVHGSKESRFDAEHWVGSNPNPLRRDLLAKSSEDEL
jgi:hypothetical protein